MLNLHAAIPYSSFFCRGRSVPFGSSVHFSSAPSHGPYTSEDMIPAATENDSYIRWYKGRDCGPRSEQGIAAKAAPVVNEGPAGAVRQGRTGVRHKTASSTIILNLPGQNCQVKDPQLKKCENCHRPLGTRFGSWNRQIQQFFADTHRMDE